jgi:hypothetical protein
MHDYVDYGYYVSLGLFQCLMNYEDIMYIRYIPRIHNIHDLKYRHHNGPNMLWIHNTHKHDNIHNQHKVNSEHNVHNIHKVLFYT